MKILLTGVTGFIGRALYPELIKREHTVTCVVRKKYSGVQDINRLFGRVFYFETLNDTAEFEEALKDIDVVIHLAAWAHKITKYDYDMKEEFMDINFHGTVNIGKQAAQRGVKRFVFISSIGVNGKSTEPATAYTEKDEVSHHSSYTFSKLCAEQALREIEEKTGMEVVILRPPLVYGPEVKGNFLKLLNIIHTGLPLPFAGIRNERSLIAIDNMVDAIAECVVHEKAGGQTFIVSDGQSLSIPQLIRKISTFMGVKSRLFYFPTPPCELLLSLLNKKGIYNSLWRSLTVDSSKIRQHLEWQPKVSIDEGIQKTVQWYLKGR